MTIHSFQVSKKLWKKAEEFSSNKRLLALVSMVVLGLVVLLIPIIVTKQTFLNLHAADTTSFEAESTTAANGATVISDTTALNGQAVQLGDPNTPIQKTKYGIGMLSDKEPQLSWAAQLVGDGGFVKFYYGNISSSFQVPLNGMVNSANWAYDHNIIPIIRIDGSTAGSPGCPTDAACQALAGGIKNVVKGIPRRAGFDLWIEINNEVNFDANWPGGANPREYAYFLVQAAKAIRSIGDPRIKIMNAGLGPAWGIPQFATGIKPAEFARRMIADDPAVGNELLTGNNGQPLIDGWSTHSYPTSTLPSKNYHNGTATGEMAAIDDYLLETNALKAVGMPALPVIVSETGYTSDDFPNPAVRASNMVDAIKLWNSWNEVMAFIPFVLSDFPDLPGKYFQEYLWIPGNSGTNSDGTPTIPYQIYTDVRNYRLHNQ